ncbi:unnamed protein product [Rhizophagus irregularis]|nr:unnamed protein product [Rhizophagus irregularis]
MFVTFFFVGFRLSGHPFRRFSPFRSPISKVPAFPVAHFDGFRISGHPFGGFRISGHPFRWFPPFRSPTSKVPGFEVLDEIVRPDFLGSGILKYWTNEIGRVASPSGGVFGRTELVLRLGGSWTEFRGSFRISIWDWGTGS